MFDLLVAIKEQYKNRKDIIIVERKATEAVLVDYMRWGDPCRLAANIYIDGIYIADVCEKHVHTVSHQGRSYGHMHTNNPEYLILEVTDPHFFPKLDKRLMAIDY